MSTPRTMPEKTQRSLLTAPDHLKAVQPNPAHEFCITPLESALGNVNLILLFQLFLERGDNSTILQHSSKYNT